MLIATALAAAILGTTVTADGEPLAPARLLDPRTLAPLEASPRFPPSTRRFDFSPDRRRVAVLAGRSLRIYGLRSRRLRARVRVGRQGELTWVSRDRILTTGCDRRHDECGLTAIDATRRRVLRRVKLRAAESPLTERVGRRWLLLFSRDGVPGRTVVVVDRDGRIRHRIRLPDPTHAATLSGRLVADDGNNRIYAVDTARGTVRRTEVPGLVQLEGGLADGRQVITVQTDSGYERRPIDPATLRVGDAMIETQAPYDLTLNEEGFLRRSGPPYVGADGDFRFSQHGFDGALQWERAYSDVSGVASVTIGDHVYVGTGEVAGGPENAMHVLDLATGRELTSRPGFYSLYGRGDSGAVNGAGALPG